VQVLVLNALQREYSLGVAIRALLRTAKRRCFVTTPYLIPPPWFMTELIRTAERGADIRTIRAGESDVPVACLAGQHLYGRVLRHGIRIFEQQHPTLHAKYLAVDGGFSVVGSHNVHRCGRKHNLEIGVLVEVPIVAHRLEHDFDASPGRSKEVTLDMWQQRPLGRRMLEWLHFIGANVEPLIPQVAVGTIHEALDPVMDRGLHPERR
jgi:cardiolipin synthase